MEALATNCRAENLTHIAIHVEPVSRIAIKAINDLDDDGCDSAVGDLVHLSLIYHEVDKDYFGLLPLTRRFLRSHVAKNRAFTNTSEWRMTQYYANLVEQNSSFDKWRKYPQL